jgi:hypothetical protein
MFKIYEEYQALIENSVGLFLKREGSNVDELFKIISEFHKNG